MTTDNHPGRPAKMVVGKPAILLDAIHNAHRIYYTAGADRWPPVPDRPAQFTSSQGADDFELADRGPERLRDGAAKVVNTEAIALQTGGQFHVAGLYAAGAL